jgi:predicted transcriptional regulator
MKRTTIFLPEGLERDLQGLARRERKPLAWCVREALARYVASQRHAARLPSFAGVGAGEASDTAERHEELLWTAAHETPLPPVPAAATAAKALPRLRHAGRQPAPSRRRRTSKR